MKFGHVRADRRTDRHADRNTLDPYRGEVATGKRVGFVDCCDLQFVFAFLHNIHSRAYYCVVGLRLCVHESF